MLSASLALPLPSSPSPILCHPTPRPADLRRCVFATASYVCVARHERPPSPPFAPAAYTLLPPLLVTRAMKPDVPQLLLVEEDELLADITAFRLELLGYTVICVRSAEQAQARLQQDPLPAIILLDTTLPDINGLELLGRLSSGDRTHAIPVMVLTIDADLNAVQKAYRAGAKDYLVLPYDPAVLEQKVERLMGLAASAAATEQKAAKEKKAVTVS